MDATSTSLGLGNPVSSGGSTLTMSNDGDDGLELGLGIGGSCSSASSACSSSSCVKIPKAAGVGVKRSAVDVVGWPPIRRGQRMPVLPNRIKSDQEEFSNNITNKRHLSIKVNMDGTLIGRKVDLYAHSSYEMLTQTLENMFYGTHNLLNGTSEFVLTYEDKDGDCMLVGDVPWQMFLSSVKRLRILRNTNMQQ